MAAFHLSLSPHSKMASPLLVVAGIGTGGGTGGAVA